MRNGKFCSTVWKRNAAYKHMDFIAAHKEEWDRNLNHAITESTIHRDEAPIREALIARCKKHRTHKKGKKVREFVPAERQQTVGVVFI